MAQITVDVGVKLNVMQSSLADLQKVLSHLEPDSTGFKSLSKVINEMTREMEKFQVQTSKGFTSNKQFDQAERSIEKMEETLVKAQIAMSNLKFSDIKLDANQTKAFESLEQAITVAEQRLESIKEKTKQGIIADSASVNTLARLNPNAIQKSFDEIDAIVSNGVKKVEGDLINAKAKFDELNKAVAEQTAASGKASNLFKNGITQQDWGELLNKTGAGFKSGGKQEFLKILKEQFEVSDADIAQLQKLSFGKINEAFKGNKFPDIFKNLNESLAKNNTGLADAKNKVKEYEDLQKAVEALYQKMSAAKADGTPLGQGMSDYNAEIERISQALAKLRGEAVQGVGANSAFTGSISAMQGQLQGFVNQLDQASAAFLRLQAQQQTFNSIKMAITNFMGFNQVLNLTKTAVHNAMNHIKELDTVMNGIAIVTNMNTADLWKQVDAYSAIAQKYGVTIKGAYEVSKIYYQQGLETNDVLTMTNATLELSKVSGLDYAKSTDYMTTAVRGFKMEMQEASTVVDVYSNLAANTAVSQEELAVAMSKTASSMESVGSTFEETSAMIATMVAVTRESATNIGSAMKSIASRYGELTKDPAKLIDAEGEAMAFNKVDAALQSVGISMKDANGQFREFTDVILELSDAWGDLTSVQQRYIATQFAGNRQQSRFLALISNGDLLRENIETAENSEDVGTLQALKAMDSLESKINQVQVAYQQFYTTIGAENIWKTLLDGTTNFINTLNGLPKLFDKIPIGAIAAISNVVGLIKSILISSLSNLATLWAQYTKQATLSFAESGQKAGNSWVSNLINEIKNGAGKAQQAGQDVAKAFVDGQIDAILKRNFTVANVNLSDALGSGDLQNEFQARLNEIEQIINGFTEQQKQKFEQLKNTVSDVSSFNSAMEQVKQELNSVGQTSETTTSRFQNFKNALGDKNSTVSQSILNLSRAFVTLGMMIDKTTESGRKLSATFTGMGGAMQAGLGIVQAISTGGVIGLFNAAPTILNGVIQIINAFDLGMENSEEKLERLNKEAEELSNTAKQIKADYKTLQQSVDKIEELRDKRYESAEAAEAYQTAVDELTEKFPAMIAGFDEAGNVILNTTTVEETLAKAREQTAQATYDALLAEQKAKAQEAEKARIEANKKIEESVGKGRPLVSSNFGNYNRSSLGDNAYDISTYRDQYMIDLSRNVSAEEASKKVLTNIVNDIGENSNLGQFLINQFRSYTNPQKSAEEFQKFIEDPQNYFDTNELKSNISLEDILPEIDALQQVFGIESGSQKAFNKVKELLETEGPKDIDWVNDLRPAIEELTKYGEGYAKLAGMLLNDTGLAEAFSELGQAVELKGEVDTTSRLIVSAWQATLTNEGKAWEVLSKRSELGVLVTQGIVKDAQESGKDWAAYSVENKEDANEIVASYEQFWASLNESQQTALNDMLKNADRYTPQDFGKFFQTNNITPTADIVNDIYSYYGDTLKNVRTRLQNNLKQFLDMGEEEDLSDKELDSTFLDEYRKLIIKEYSEFSQGEETVLQNILNFYDKLANEGFKDQAEAFGQRGLELYNFIQTLPGDVQAGIIQLIKDNGLTTKEDIQNILSGLKNNPQINDTQFAFLEDSLNELQELIISNLGLNIQASLDDFVKNWSDVSKQMKKMTSGLELSDVQSLINSAESFDVEGFSLTFDDFQSINGKLTLSAKKAKDYWSAYAQTTEKEIQDWNTELENATKELGLSVEGKGELTDVKNLTEQQREAIKVLLGERYKTFFDEQGALLEDISSDDLQEAIVEAIKATNGQLNNYLQYLEWAQKEVLNSSAYWAQGDYSSLINSGVAALQTKEGSFNNEYFNKLLSGTEQYNAKAYPELKEAVTQARNGLNTFLTDLLSKGVTDINLSEYLDIGISTGIKQELGKPFNDLKQGLITYEQFVQQFAARTGKTATEIDALVAQAHAKDYENNVYDALKDVIGSFDKFSYEAGQKLVRVLKIDALPEDIFDVDPITGELISNYKDMLRILNESALNKTSKQYLELRAQLEKAQVGQDRTSQFTDIISKRDKLNEDNIASLAEIFGTTYDRIQRMLIQNADGSYTMNLSTIQEMIDKGRITVSEEIKEIIANEIDSIISSLTGLGQLQGKGTTSIEDMQKRVGNINQQFGTDFKMQDLFTYNENLNAFTYSTQGLQLQAASLAKELDSLRQNTEANADQIWAVEQSMRNIALEMANNIDISGFLGMAIGDPARELKIDELRQAIEDYNTVLTEIGETEGLNASVVISALRQGGEGAVQAAEQIAAIQGKTLSASDVESAYRNQISNFVNAIDTIVAQPGVIVDTITASIISSNGGAVNELGNTGQYVVESAANLYEAYKDLLQRMINTGEVTLADLNKVAALALENRDREQAAIDALGDAAGMTFTRFGEILTDAGIQLTEQMVDDLEASGIIGLMGGNKMRITDFSAFANLMGWQANSEEYVSAFKSYNDSMIALNEQTKNTIMEELAKVSESKGEDWVNITQLYSSLNTEMQTKLAENLKKVGANLDNGILKLDTSAQMSEVYGALVGALKDVEIEIDEALNFDNLFNMMTQTGGGLENVSQTTAKIAEIQREIKANQAAINDLETMGLSSQDSAVTALRNQNAELREQLNLYERIQSRQADNPESYNFMNNKLPDYLQGPENYWNSIGKAFESMNSAAKDGHMSIQDFHNIVNEMNNMAAISGTTLEFMGQELGGKAEDAANLITNGMAYLENVDGKGVKINMKKFGVNIADGAADMQKGFDAGIKAMAQSQIDMLDAAIQMLEVVVAMEQLGDIDIDSDNHLNLGEIFNLDTQEPGDFSEGYTKWAESIEEQAKNNEDLKEALDNITIGGHTMGEMIDAATGTIEEQKEKFAKLGITEEQYAAVMDAFYQAAINGDYDLEHLQESVWDVLNKTLSEGTVIDTGNRSIIISGGTNYSIDWQAEDTQEALNLFKGEEEEKKQQLKDAFIKYQQGEGSEIEVKSVLVAKGLIKIDTETGDIIGPDGKTYKSGTATAQKIVAEAALKDAGLDPTKGTQKKRTTETGKIYTTIETKTTVGNKTVLAYTDESGNVKYHSDKLNKDFGSQDELLRAEFAEFEAEARNHGATTNMSFEDWVYMNYHINLKTESTLTDENGNAVDPNGSQIRQEMKDKLAESLKNGVNEGDVTQIEGLEGQHFLIKLPSGNQLEFVQGEGESFQDAYNRALSEQLGIDQSLIDNIATGIQTAFTGEGGAAISEALANGIQTALGANKDISLPEGTPTPEISLPEVSIKPQKITFNTSEMPEISSEGEATATANIPNLNISSIEKATYSDVLQLEDISEATATVKNLSVDATNVQAGSGLSSLQNMDFSNTSSSLGTLSGYAGDISGASFNNFKGLVTDLGQAAKKAGEVWDSVKKFASQTFTVNLEVQGQESTVETTENKTTNETINTTETHTVNEVSNTQVNVDTSGAQASAGDLGNAAATMGGQASAAASNISGLQTALSGLASAVLLLKAQTNVLKGSLSGLSGSVVGVKGKIDTLRSAITSIPNNGTRVSTLAEAMKKIPTTGAEKITNLSKAIGKIPTTKDASVTLKYSVSAAAKGNVGNAQAKGNTSALVAGTRKTLMGELGPELVVSNGRYYVVGQNGAEFVDLAKDAIVFNHKQTKRLLEQGMIGSRGRPITNENNAISFAKGKLPLSGAAMKDPTSPDNPPPPQKVTEKISSVSVSPASETIKLFSYAKGSGPALASAAAALAALKELRAMWQSLLDAGAKELGSMAGRNGGGGGKGKGGKGKKPKKGGGGGGGGGSGDDKVTKEIELGTITEEIQRWYDLLRQIDKLEQDISYQQALRKKYESDRIANGEKIYNTYQKELGLLTKEIDNQKQLADLQKSWYDAKRAELAETSYSKIFTYTEDGLQQYTGTGKPGSKLGLDILETLTRRDAKGKYALNVNQQLNYLKKVGFDLNELRYNDDGTVLAKLDKASVKKALVAEGKKDITDNDIKEKQAEIMTQMMENFWSRVDGWRDELDSLYDSYNETATNIQENITKQNEILQQLVDNELSVEKDIYEAIEAREQAEIDRLKEEKELLNNTTDKIVSGLNDQLSKEKEQYNKQKESDDLGKLQRQLAILQRSGGSASQIRTLQQQIDSKMQDQYFSKQEESINNIKEAADKQIERLEQQIDIQTQILDYQKANGLIWEEVRYIMENLDEDTIISHIKEWNPKFNENSTLQVSEDLKDIRERLQIYLADKTTRADKEEGFKQISFESNENTNALNKIKPENQTAAELDARSSAKEAYNNAIDTGKTKEEATKMAQSAYTKSLKKTQATEQGQSLEQTKQNILAKENEGKEEEEQKTVSTAETNLAKWKANESAYGAIKDKNGKVQKGWYSTLDSNQKAAFDKLYYENIQKQLENGTEAENLDYSTALNEAATTINNQIKGTNGNSFKTTTEIPYYTYNKEKKKWTKKGVLNKGKTLNLVGYDSTKKYVKVKIGKNSYWIAKSSVPKANLTELTYTAALNQATEKADAVGKTVTIDGTAKGIATKGYDFNVAAGAALGNQDVYWRDTTSADTPQYKKLLSKGKWKKGNKKVHISKINGLQSDKDFSSIVIDKIDGKTLYNAKKKKINLTLTAKQLQGIKQSKKSLYQIIKTSVIPNFKFATGGMADFTGPAWLDGTKKKPEAVLNADQTRFLKEDLLGNSSNSLMSIVSALQDSMNSTYTSSVDNSNSVVIENISLNFEAGTISNDYDARRAGDTVVKEILKIARKTGNNSVSRR